MPRTPPPLPWVALVVSFASHATDFEYTLNPTAVVGELEIRYTTQPEFYYLIGTLEEASFQPRETIDFYFDEETTERHLVIRLGNSQSTFIKIAQSPFANPGDFDGDGIDDLYERDRSEFLDLADPLDRFRDQDFDGLSNFEEYLRGTDPEISGNYQPTARIVTPDSEITAELGTSLSWEASAIHLYGEIAQVDFLVNGQVLQVFTEAPYSLLWIPTVPGSYELTTIAYDELGLASNPETVKASVQVPFLNLAPSATNTSLASISLSGAGILIATVRVVGGAETILSTVPENGAIELEIPLRKNRMNRLFACQVTQDGAASPQQALEIIQNKQDPTLHVDFPEDGSLTTADSAVVARRQNRSSSNYVCVPVFWIRLNHTALPGRVWWS